MPKKVNKPSFLVDLIEVIFGVIALPFELFAGAFALVFGCIGLVTGCFAIMMVLIPFIIFVMFLL